MGEVVQLEAARASRKPQEPIEDETLAYEGPVFACRCDNCAWYLRPDGTFWCTNCHTQAPMRWFDPNEPYAAS